jgi:hypothetical protein
MYYVIFRHIEFNDILQFKFVICLYSMIFYSLNLNCLF